MISHASEVAFNHPYIPEKFLEYIAEIRESRATKGDGYFSKKSSALISEFSGGGKVFLTPSCTHALEMSTMLLNLKPGDEVITPSFTFTSAVTALSNFGVVPVFVEIDPLTKNIDPKSLDSALSSRTRAISVVNYAGVACDFPLIAEFANDNGLKIIEDNAHGLLGSAYNKKLGSFGSLSTLSFHESKNFHCGEGGALIVNDAELIERAEIIREKGTNRNKFLRGEVDKYTWVDLGSSQLMPEVSAALLLSQLEMATTISQRRLNDWNFLYNEIVEWGKEFGVEMPFIPKDVTHTAHIFYLITPSINFRDRFVSHLKKYGVPALFHYQPLHNSPAGLKYGRVGSSDFSQTIAVSQCLLRLPIYYDMHSSTLSRIVEAVTSFSD